MMETVDYKETTQSWSRDSIRKVLSTYKKMTAVIRVSTYVSCIIMSIAHLSLGQETEVRGIKNHRIYNSNTMQ